LIPARGGSKGLPRKNVRWLAGKPLIAHVLDEALRARLVTRVVVSTDDAEIAGIARQRGAEIIDRPPEISGDAASSESAVLHALEVLERREGYRPDLTMMVQCTSPLTLAEDMDGAIETLLEKGADSCLTASRFHHFLWRQAEGGDASGINHDMRRRLRRQDMEPQFLENGALYLMRTDGFRSSRHRFFGRTVLHVMPSDRHLEIDDLAEFEVAEMQLRRRGEALRMAALPTELGALVMDFDGVHTDNRVLVTESGSEAVRCHRGDGMGLEMLRKLGLPLVVLSKEANPVVTARCRKLGIECMQSLEEKLPAMRRWLDGAGIDARNAIYVGNDVNDLSCMKAVGCSVAPADAHDEAKRAARIILAAAGGRGALRELCDLIMTARQEGRLSIAAR
jgi:N-acylneuraminate cytidylyltransferase